jgi:PhoPQ-activated pathogenicity-related protein
MLIYPMSKACLNIMKAVQEYSEQEKILEPDSGMVVLGASKRGWTTWMIGTVQSDLYPTILGIVPMVPIVPMLNKDLHRQWMAYDGFSFAFQDYMDAGLIDKIDEDFI